MWDARRGRGEASRWIVPVAPEMRTRLTSTGERGEVQGHVISADLSSGTVALQRGIVQGKQGAAVVVDVAQMCTGETLQFGDAAGGGRRPHACFPTRKECALLITEMPRLSMMESRHSSRASVA
mmetsp:Transcript_86899/g.198408  ORF Transcript_86899/g.198408 Transcript_86899/m.198408 type:complete len:124 (-) Transcript_86899:734-1105(-)